MKDKNVLIDLPVEKKICVSLSEAASLSGLSVNVIKQIIKKNPDNEFTVFKDFRQGRTQLIKRNEFEKYISKLKL